MRYTLSYTIAAIGQEAVSVVTVLRARQYLSTTVTSTYPETPAVPTPGAHLTCFPNTSGTQHSRAIPNSTSQASAGRGRGQSRPIYSSTSNLNFQTPQN